MSALLPALLPETLPRFLPDTPVKTPKIVAFLATEGAFDRWWEQPACVEWADCPASVQRIVLSLWLCPASMCKALAQYARVDHATARHALEWLHDRGLAGIVGHDGKALWALSDRGDTIAQQAQQALL